MGFVKTSRQGLMALDQADVGHQQQVVSEHQNALTSSKKTSRTLRSSAAGKFIRRRYCIAQRTSVLEKRARLNCRPFCNDQIAAREAQVAHVLQHILCVPAHRTDWACESLPLQQL